MVGLGCNSLPHTHSQRPKWMRAHAHIQYTQSNTLDSLVSLCVLPSIFAGAYKIYGSVEPSDLDATCVRRGWVGFNHGPIRHILFHQQETHKYTERFWFFTGQCWSQADASCWVHLNRKPNQPKHSSSTKRQSYSLIYSVTPPFPPHSPWACARMDCSHVELHAAVRMLIT